MKRFRMDGLVAAYNLDASESAYIERQLLQVRTRLYEVKFPDLTATAWVPPEGQRLDPGANHFTYQYVTHYGTVKLHTGMSERGPRAEVKKTEATPIPFVSKTNSYGYSLQDLRASQLANFDLPGNKAKAARMAMAQWRDAMLLVGDGTATYDGLTGLFKLSGTVTYTVPTGVSASKLWSTKTADEMVEDMHGVCNAIITGSNNVESPDTLGLPLAAYLIAARTRMGDGDSTTVLEHFLKVRRVLKPGFEVMPHFRLDTAGGSSDGRMIAYSRDPEKVARLDSVDFEQLQPQVVAWETVTDCHMRTAGVYTAYPKSIAYGDGIC